MSSCISRHIHRHCSIRTIKKRTPVTMKLLALIFLSACIVAISHQQFHHQWPRGAHWWSPYHQSFPVDREDNNPFPRQLLRRPYSRTPPYFYEQNTNFDFDQTAELNGQNDMDGDGFPGAQSRIKGSNNFLLQDSLYEQSNPRFLYSFGSASFYNPFFKTATFTLTSTLTLASIQSCVPSNNFLAGTTPKSCRRKRSENDYFNGDDQFPISPSETLRLETTATLPSPQDYTLDVLSSSRDDITPSNEISTPSDRHLRDKRFFFINKNQFVVSSTLTTYAFINRTVTVTANLLTNVPAAGCLAAALAAGDVVCLACLPAGYIVCP